MSQIPVWIIILVVIIVLILIVVIASIATKTTPPKSKDVELVSLWNSELPRSIDTTKQTDIIPISLEKVSDSWTFTFDSLQPSRSYILGSKFTDSTISVYKKVISETEDTEVLLYSKLYSGNQGIVISGNLYNVNASYYHIGKNILLPNIKHNLIKIGKNDCDSTFTVVINNIGPHPLKVYQCNFIPTIQTQWFENSIPKTLMGFSEYDIEKYLSQTQDLSLLKRVPWESFYRNQDKWEFQGSGNYVLFYVKNIYSFLIKDKNQLLVSETNPKSLKHCSLEIGSLTLQDPFLQIKNFDETIDTTDINRNVVNFFQKPLQWYNQFVNGTEQNVLDMWNQISNKIFLYKKEFVLME